MAKRISALDATLRALGGKMEEWNGMALPYAYPTSLHQEHDAVRDAVGMWDTSALTKIHVRGPDALATVDYLVTRDMSKIPIGKSAYCPILKDDGHFCDDAIINNMAEDHYLVASSTGPTHELLQDDARGRNVSIEDDDDLHVIAVQGPKSLELLDAHSPANLRELVFSHHIDTTLFGKSMMISRTGFSGERGYEIFVSADDVVEVWQGLMDRGQPLGLLPISVPAIELIGVESGLMLYDADATEENTLWEVDFGWTVSRNKGDFRGKQALFELEGREKVKLTGIVADHDDAVDRGAELSINGEIVGHVTTPAYSRRLGKSLALAHLIPSAARKGTALELKGPNVQCRATAARIPFVDPERKRLHAM